MKINERRKRMDKKVIWSIVGISIGVILLLFVLGTVLEFGSLALLKPKLGLKRRAIQSSLQYVESHTSLLWQLYEEYQTAEGAHREVLIKRMRVEARRIPESEVPQEIWRVIQ